MSQQAELFAPEKRQTYGEMTRQRKRDLARSDLVKDEVLAVFRAKAGEWISGAWTDKDLDRIEKKHDLGAYFYDAIHALRGANFWQAWLGPLCFGWRRPWLRGPAEQHLKQHYGDA